MVERAVEALLAISSRPELLARHGLSTDEFTSAFPAAIEALRGRKSASNADRRQFVAEMLQHLVDRGVAGSVTTPEYGSETVYRVDSPDWGPIAIIQKGCPDGVHSSVNWSVPEWAEETYLWWVCSSLKMHPGEHIAKGVARLRKQFRERNGPFLSGVIFHSDLCGGPNRPCPKMGYGQVINGKSVPPPCIYVLPRRGDGTQHADEMRELHFPRALLRAFQVTDADLYTGEVAFHERQNGAVRTTISARFGAGRSSIFRSTS